MNEDSSAKPNLLKSRYAGIAVNDLKPRTVVGPVVRKTVAIGRNAPNVIARLGVDGNVYAKNGNAANQLADLMNYKIRTEGDIAKNKALPTVSVPTTVVDLGKQLLKFARDSDLPGVKYMLSRDAPFVSDWLGMTALHFAAMNNQHEMCELLLKCGINKDCRTKVDRTPLHVASYYGNTSIVELLVSKNCQINPRDMLAMTPLHWAINRRHKTVVRILLKNNADVTVVSKFNKTPMGLAVLTEQADLLEELQAARKAQVERQERAKHEKEVSAAVNSIMFVPTKPKVIPNILRKGGTSLRNFTNFTANTNNSTTKNNNLNNFKRRFSTNHHNNNSTMHLLNKHGISVQQDENESSELLNTALHHGRQLVLTEGGKMLLTESNISSANVSAATSCGVSSARTQIEDDVDIDDLFDNIEYSVDSSENERESVVTSGTSPPSTSPTVALTRTKLMSSLMTNCPKVVQLCPASAPQSSGTFGNNQNVRIISLKDFKNNYGSPSALAGNNTSLPPLPPQLQSRKTRERLGLAEAGGSRTNDESKRAFNQNFVEQPKKIKLIKEAMIKMNSDVDGSNISHETELSEPFPTENRKATNLGGFNLGNSLSNQHSLNNATNNSNNYNTYNNNNHNNVNNNNQSNNNNNGANNSNQYNNCNIRRIEMPVFQMNALNSAIARKAATNNNNVGQPTVQHKINNITPGSVIPALTLPDLSRQFFELRRQHNDLKRKFEVSQRMNEDMRLKIERLEEIVLDKTNIEPRKFIKVEPDAGY